MTPPSYAVVWSGDDGVVHAGRLELDDDHVTLVGSSGPHEGALRTVQFDEIAGVRRERFRGQHALLLERRHGGGIRLTSANGRTVLPELQDRLARAIGRREETAGASGPA